MEGILHSVLTFYFSIYIVGGGVNDKGQAFSLWTISVLTYYVIVFCANWKVSWDEMGSVSWVNVKMG